MNTEQLKPEHICKESLYFGRELLRKNKIDTVLTGDALNDQFGAYFECTDDDLLLSLDLFSHKKIQPAVTAMMARFIKTGNKRVNTAVLNASHDQSSMAYDGLAMRVTKANLLDGGTAIKIEVLYQID